MPGAVRVLHVSKSPFLDGDNLYLSSGHTKEKFVVDTVDSLSGVRDRLESTTVDCIVSGVELSDASGLELQAMLREMDSDVPFIFFPVIHSATLAREAAAAGVTRYLPQDPERDTYPVLAAQIIEVVSTYQTTERSRELERVNSVVRDIDRALVRASTQAEIDQRVCEIISQSDPYLFTWIGDHDPDSETVTRRAAAGIEQAYLEEITITTDDGATAQGPTGQAVRTQELQVMQNIPEDPAYEPWREQALERGYKSSAAIPLVYEGTLHGILNVYADRVEAFGEDEQRLLAELGETIGYALDDVHVRDQLRHRQRAIERAGDAIFITDRDGTITYVNPAFESLTGFTSSEAIGRNPRILKSGEMDEQHFESLWTTILAGEVWDEEIVNARKSGDHYYAEQTIAPIPDRTGDVDGFVAIQRDVTARKERERELEQAEQRLSFALEAADAAVWEVDLESNEIVWDESMEQVVGLDPGSFEGTYDAVADRVHPDDYDDIRATIDKAIEQGGKTRHELRFVDGSGEIQWLDTRARVFADSEGEPSRMVGISIDVTERKERERELQKNRTWLRILFDQAPDGIVVHDVCGDVFDVNEALVGMLSYTRDELLEMTVTDFEIGISESELKEQWAAMSPGSLHKVEVEGVHRQKDGSTYPVEVWISRIQRNDLGDRFVAFVRDITERRQRIRQLRVLDRVLRHNVHNKMAIIRGYAETIEEIGSSDELVGYAQNIIEGSDDLLKTVDKERDIVQVVSQRPERTTIDLAETTKQVVDSTRSSYPASRIEFEGPEAASVTATTALDRMAEELLENAAVHSDRAIPEIDVSIMRSANRVTLRVADNGPEIPEDEVRILTEEEEIEPLYHGSGLGLWLVYWIVEQSNGEIQFEANEPRGNVIEISLESA